MKKTSIPFTKPDITQDEIDKVVDVLKSGWITTGSVTKDLEKVLSEYCSVKRTKCLSSATAGMFLLFKIFGLKEGDEVITTPFTYAATANSIILCGAKPVFVDIKNKNCNIDPSEIEKLINSKTKAVLSVDYGGIPVDYDTINKILDSKKNFFIPQKDSFQEKFSKPLFISDAAHSFGSIYKNKKTGSQADFFITSFHAVKNLTSAEGGAVFFNGIIGFDSDEIYKYLSLYSLHGQDKSAFDKYTSSSWEYDISLCGYKFNITDLQSAIAYSQLKRYDSTIIPIRKKICGIYNEIFSKDSDLILPELISDEYESSYHLYFIRIKSFDEKQRNRLLGLLSENGINANVHFKPLPLFTAYKKLGYKIEDFPESYKEYSKLITLPLSSVMTEKDAEYVASTFLKLKKSIK